MLQNPDHQPPYQDDDEIDLIELAKTIWEGRKIVIYSVIVFIALGLFVALGSSEEYTSEVKLMPEAQGERVGQLGGLARQFGIGAMSSGTGEGIPPNLYPDVTNSLPLMQLLMEHEVYVERLDTSATIFTYLTELNPASPVSVVTSYTIGLPFTILGKAREWFTSNKPKPPGVLPGDSTEVQHILRLNKEQWEMVRILRERIRTRFDEQSGMINVSVDMPDAEVAADVAHQVVLFLTDYITTYRTDKARENMDFIEGRYEDARERFENSQRRLAEFTDRHRGTMTAVAEIEMQRLQSEYNLAFNLYNSMAERFEEARISLQEDTPVVKVIDPAAVPDQRSSPRRGMILLITALLGGMVGLGIIFGNKMIASAKEQW